MATVAWRNKRKVVLATFHSFHRKFCHIQNNNKKKGNVVVGMSGGVDSSVVALLLHREGYNVTGVYMKNWDSSDELGQSTCPSEKEFMDVTKVCKQIGIPVKMGTTPNPDVLCNREIKFNVFLKYAYSIGADYFATGHYARLKVDKTIDEKHGTMTLLKGVDDTKDQSYFLAQVESSCLRNVLFPLGNMKKSQVREIAREAGLCTAENRDSAGICFIGRRKFGNFISQYVRPQKGHFVSVDGKFLGHHNGISLYTIGQKAKIGGMNEKWFVVSKDVSSGHITCAPGSDHPALYYDSLFLSSFSFNWISGRIPSQLINQGVLECQASVRYRQTPSDCTVTLIPKSILQNRQSTFENAQSTFENVQSTSKKGEFLIRDEEENKENFSDDLENTEKEWLIRVDFHEPHKAITVHQTVVLYSNDICLGGGAIESTGLSYYQQKKSLPKNLSRYEHV